MHTRHSHPQRPAKRPLAHWLTLASLAALSACGGSGDDDEALGIPQDLPAMTLSGDADIVPQPALGRLVAGPASASSQDAFARIARYFSRHADFSSAAALQPGDVLLLDGSQATAEQLAAAGQLAAQAFAAQVPLLIVGFDDVLEEAIHQQLPSASIPGYSSIALIEPPRAGQPWSDGGITMAQSDAQGPGSGPVRVSRNTLDQLAARIAAFHHQRASALQRADNSSSQCSSDDPADCARVKKLSLARVSLVEDYSFHGLHQSTRCLNRDWTPFDIVDGMFGGHQIYSGYSSDNYASTPVYFQPQCPAQSWDFYPTLYLNEPADAEPSRILQIDLGSSFNPNVADTNSDITAWYQTRRQLKVAPQTAGTATWHKMANLPTTANGQTTHTETAGWSLTVGGEAGSDGGKGSVGVGVNFSHTTTNTIPDWKLIDLSDPASGVWMFEAQQAAPYAVDGSSGAYCSSMGNALFHWLGTHCASLPNHMLTGAIKDLSLYTATLQGMAVWDLGAANNAQATAELQVQTQSWFDAAGCSRMTKKSKQDSPTPPEYLKDANCAGNQLRNNDGTWYARSTRMASLALHIKTSLLPITTAPKAAKP